MSYTYSPKGAIGEQKRRYFNHTNRLDICHRRSGEHWCRPLSREAVSAPIALFPLVVFCSLSVIGFAVLSAVEAILPLSRSVVH